MADAQIEQSPRRQSWGQKIAGNVRGLGSLFSMPDKYKCRGFNPERARGVIDYAKEHKDTLRDEVVAVGPHFDEGMKHLEDFDRIVGQFEGKWLNDDLKKEWIQNSLSMYENGYNDIAHAVESSKPVIYKDAFETMPTTDFMYFKEKAEKMAAERSNEKQKKEPLGEGFGS